MDPIHAHLILNHIPVIGSAFAAVLLLYGLGMNKSDVTRAALVAIVVVAVFTVVVVRTGEAAEDPVERIPDIAAGAIHPHEEAGEKAQLAALAAGALALAALIAGRKRERLFRTAAVLVLITTTVSFGLAGYAANLGAKIRHTELGPASQAADDDRGADRQGEDH